jgi:hypothetical protein
MAANLAFARALAPPEAEGPLADFVADGAYVLPAPLCSDAARALLEGVRSRRAFDASLFLTEEAFEADPQYRGVNPQPGRNLLEDFAAELAFVEAAPTVTGMIEALLGPRARIIDKKLVCGVPDDCLPDWVRRRIAGNPVNNLGAFVRKEFRDITYFYGIDYHQDLIDFKGREADFITLYVYLHDVGPTDAPLHLLEGSHLLGASIFPHDLMKLSKSLWRYADGRGQVLPVRERILTGGAGFAAAWHPCTLHGTQPSHGEGERISLRYLIAKGEGPAGLDAVNAALLGPIKLEETRVDLDAKGAAAIVHNAINDG